MLRNTPSFSRNTQDLVDPLVASQHTENVMRMDSE